MPPRLEKVMIAALSGVLGAMASFFIVASIMSRSSQVSAVAPPDRCAGGNGRYSVIMPSEKSTLLSVGVLDTCLGDYYIMGFQPQGPLGLRIKMADVKDYIGNPNAPVDQQQTQQPAVQGQAQQPTQNSPAQPSQANAPAKKP